VFSFAVAFPSLLQEPMELFIEILRRPHNKTFLALACHKSGCC